MVLGLPYRRPEACAQTLCHLTPTCLRDIGGARPDFPVGFWTYAATATGADAQVFAIAGIQVLALVLALVVLPLGLRERSLPGLQPTLSLPRRNQSSPHTLYHNLLVSLQKPSYTLRIYPKTRLDPRLAPKGTV